VVNFFIDRPIFATVLSIIITLGGAIALTQLPVARFPPITPPTVVVSASFPGADAATIEASVAAPIEQQMNGVPNMLYMDSKSSDGAYSLTITFDIGTDQDLAAVDVQNRLSIAQRQLPQEVIRNGVTVFKRQPQIMLIATIRATDPRYDYLFLSNYATLNVYDALARIPGVGQVLVLGARDYGMRIWLDPDRMARFGVTTQDIQSVLSEQNVVAPAGTIGGEPAPKGQQKQYPVRVQGRLSDVSEYENIVLRAQHDGSVVHLSDVARIELGATDYARSSLLNGESVAMIGIYQLPDANALDVSRRVREAMDELSHTFPEGITYEIPFDTTLFVTESVKEVQKTLFEAVVLVLIVVFVFLESWRATLIPMLAVPVSLIGAFTAFAVLGFSINTLTLFALVLAIGLVVDDAIVVVEAVVEKMDEKGLSPREATREAMRDVSGPVVAIALVLTAVFVPVAFLPGLTGQFYQQFALTLSISVLLSALVALTFTPALCALLLKPSSQVPHSGPLGFFFSWFNRGFARFTQGYTRSVRRGVRRTLIPMAVFGALAIATVGLLWSRPAGFLPEEDQGYLIAAVNLPAAASQQRTAAVVVEAQRILATIPEVQDVIQLVSFNLLTRINSPNSATLFISLKPWDERPRSEQSAQSLVKRISAALSSVQDANTIVLNPPSVPGIGAAGGFEFVLEDRAGGDLAAFNTVAMDFLAKAAQRPELQRVFTQHNANAPQIEYVIDRERAKALGIPLSNIFGSLQMFLGGSYINDFNLFGRTFRVTAQAEDRFRAAPDAVNHLYVRSQDGAMIPLSTLVSIRADSSAEFISRYNVFRAISISGSAAPGYSSGQAVAAMEELAADLPPGFAYEWSGVTYQEKKSGGQAPYVFGLAVLFVFLVLAALYESWAVPFAVLLGIPFAVFGAFAGLAARGMDNDIYAQIGLVMLIGLAAKNAILIVEFAKLAHERGMPLLEAAVEGARLRLRPILMTSLAFILGTLPLALASGAGAGSRSVLGTTVVFGMLAATIIGIFIIPVFYVIIAGVAERISAMSKPKSTESVS
jgi:HAE1 family hydrophobic/amphiphilic exporter-1/multidrug efflux pump